MAYNSTHTGIQIDNAVNAVNNKVDKVSGKGLSTNDYTSEEKAKLAGIAVGAEVNVNADWTATEGKAQILNKPVIVSPTVTTSKSGTVTTISITDKDGPHTAIINDGANGTGGTQISVDGSEVNSIDFSSDPQSQINLLKENLANANAIIHETVAQAVEETISNISTVSIPSTVTVGSTAYPVIDNTRMLLSEVKGKSGTSKNLFSDDVAQIAENTIFENGKYTTRNPNNSRVLRNTFVRTLQFGATVQAFYGRLATGIASFTITKDNTFNQLKIGILCDGENICVVWDCSNIQDGTIFTVSFNVDDFNLETRIVHFSNIQVEYGSNATTYSPYFDGIKSTSFEGVKVTGKNLVDISKLSYSSIISNIADSTGSFTINGAYTSVYNYRGFLSNLQVGHTYRLVANVSQNISRNYVYLGSGGVWEFGKIHTITETDLASNNFMTIYGIENVDVRYSGFMIIDETEDATHYEPYRETNLISLIESQELKSAGTAQDRLYIEKNTDDEFYSLKKEIKVGTGYFNGQEEIWPNGSSTETKKLYQFYNDTIPNCKDSQACICSHFEYGYTVNHVYVESWGGIFVMDSAAYPTADSFKAFLLAQYNAGTPVTIYYVLATPTIEVLKNDLTFEEVSAIAEQGGTISIVGNDSETYDVKPDLSAVFEIKYWQEN